jgi:hypothetical protein
MRGRQTLPVPFELRIVRFFDDSGCYLFYCDEDGREFTDTYHANPEGAMAQAAWEFGVRPDEWEEPPSASNVT